MYLWRIGLLKNQLREGPLGQRAAFAYIFATLLLYVITTASPAGWNSKSEAATWPDWLTYALMIIIAGGGTYAAYRANGGQAGSDFAARYFALGWVLFLRLGVLLFVPMMVLMFGAGAELGAFQANSERIDKVFGWGLVHHLRQVAIAPTR